MGKTPGSLYVGLLLHQSLLLRSDHVARLGLGTYPAYESCPP